MATQEYVCWSARGVDQYQRFCDVGIFIHITQITKNRESILHEVYTDDRLGRIKLNMLPIW